MYWRRSASFATRAWPSAHPSRTLSSNQSSSRPRPRHQVSHYSASIQATFNLLDQSAGPLLEAAAANGVFVIIKEALANGRLTSRAADSPGKAVLLKEAEALGTTVDALALVWVMTHPWVGMCLSGASSAEMLKSNAEALKLTPLSEDVHKRLGEALCQETESYWADRRALAWN